MHPTRIAALLHPESSFAESRASTRRMQPARQTESRNTPTPPQQARNRQRQQQRGLQERTTRGLLIQRSVRAGAAMCQNPEDEQAGHHAPEIDDLRRLSQPTPAEVCWLLEAMPRRAPPPMAGRVLVFGHDAS